MNPDSQKSPLNLQAPDTTNGENSKYVVDLFKTVGDHFRNDINSIWIRSQFFLTANIALMAYSSSTYFKRDDWTEIITIGGIGTLLSILWFFMARSSATWIQVWRITLVDMEKNLVSFGPFARGENITGKDFHERNRPEIIVRIAALTFTGLWLIRLILLFPK